MQLKVVKTQTEFDELASQWNDLLTKSASQVPFLRHEYLSTWWKTRGGGEWDHGDLRIVTAYDEAGQLTGIAPLFRTDNLNGKPALMFLGSIEISDYLDLISPPENLPVFADSLLEYLTGPEVGEWEVLDLYNFLEASATLAALKECAEARGWHYAQERIQPAPAIQLPKNWDDYLASLDKKQRHEVRRKIRRAENYLVPVRWYIVEDQATLDAEIEAFLQLMAHDPQKDAFLTDLMRTQMRESIQAAFRAGWLQLAFLEVGGQKAGAYLSFDYRDKIWVYNSGIDFQFRKLSPGWVLAGYLIQWAIENGRDSFDFMRGDEVYKYRLGGVDRFVVRVQISRRGS